MRRPMTPVSLCVLLLLSCTFTSPPALAVGRPRTSKNRLALWIDRHQVKSLIGLDMDFPIISDGQVTPYVNSPEVVDRLIIPPEIDTVNLTWLAGAHRYKYVFDNFTSLDQHLLYQPLLGIPDKGDIPHFATVFQITIPCKGKEKGVASLLIRLKIYEQGRKPPPKGTSIEFRLKKQCNIFVTSSLCRPGCRNGGTCNVHGVCECPQGYKGVLCDIALCTPACQNNGTCISPATCACPPGFHGDYCEKGTSLSTSAPASVCGRMCQNGGHCLPEGYCWCTLGFYGDACEYHQCSPMCLNGGTCTGMNHCLCTDTFSGPLCEKKEDVDRGKRSKEDEQKENRKTTQKPPKKVPVNKGIDGKLRKAEKRLLKIIFRRSQKWVMSPEERQALNKLNTKSETEDLKLQERRYLIKFLTRERKHLTSKDKTKLKRFKNLIRKVKNRQQKPRNRRLYNK
ncbi:unnamed protein product [Lymnaea stagnalis]|uniref:Wnt inhibitory factor 1 n=1 Tax=Lymnaea stagnalis TaxID=6523 RepID=A0AAV2HB82_LYMST